MSVDRDLIVRARAGEDAAHETLILQCSPMVFRVISRFFHHREQVEDLAQEVFLKVFTRIHQVRPDENFPGWLRRVAVNACYDELRKTRRRVLALGLYGHETARTIPTPVEPKDFTKLRLALESLDPKLRVPLVLKEMEELSVAEIAEVLGITTMNVKIRLFRARKRLVEQLHPK